MSKLPSRDEMKDQQKKQDGPPWKSLEPVVCLVENCGMINKDDSYFYTELRVLSGSIRGELVKQNWSRQWKSGDWKEDTVDLLRTLCEKEDAEGAPIWSYMLKDKCFRMTPVQSKKGFWNFKDFSVSEIPEADRADFEAQKASKAEIDNIPF